MQQRLNGVLTRLKDAFTSFTTGQKTVAIVGTAALLVALFLVVRWVSAPSYSPLYTNLSGEDASAIVEELNAQGIKYEITNGGSTIMVPRSEVYSARIDLSGKNLPAASKDGYGLLDEQSLSTSESQERTNFKRAMEGELATTIEAIDGVETAVVHLAIPEKRVFTDEQDPATASVLVATARGGSLDDEQVQAVVHLVASSIDGLDPKKVTVADSTGRVLTTDAADGSVGAASTRNKQVKAFQDTMQAEIQALLDPVVGAGNSMTTVTADLDFDKSVTDSRTYNVTEGVPPLSETRSRESYQGTPGGANDVGGVVGPDGQMDGGGAGTDGDSEYENTTTTRDNAVGETVERRETAPGAVKSLHVAVVLDATAAAAIQPAVIQDLISSGIGIKADRGDTIEVSSLPFDKSAQEAAAAELAAAKAADAADRKNTLIRNLAIGGGIMLMVLLAWWQARRRAAAREEATSYIVEQLRLENANRPSPELETPALTALEAVESSEDDTMREELIALVERQPDDVAALLRGWLVEPRS